METLGDALPKEIARVRDEILPVYLEIGPAGEIAAAMIRADLNAASKAMMEGDVVSMINIYNSLKGYEL